MELSHRLGQAAPEFELPDIAGPRYQLQDFSGHWLLLVFHRHLG